ncbi:DUF378 domain-containing protein [Alicyclobacillus cycloheptanicus]|uniref:Uncharacterized membrane protein YuzA (DUF378 family) n=1 Tax=Alicyclobacillus cycloheptanicus TaxID=1457 RepID=A0ABT9XHF6_9BACL|nr:DUF378 domain-containing protein [Alicyclobacillus cycloheptanicus]MDQ0189166.1 uncharacterized membrane protein YuzA (DUF378 family) [Alicyclobacillus cycloheptanicus]WDM00357.1 DUF378 domain-containing protein [Alicyclobacillus cycloheptanicus]
MVERVAWWLILAGALNWLLVGVFHWDLIAYLFGGADALITRLLYIVIGLAGVYLLPQAFGVRMVHRK